MYTGAQTQLVRVSIVIIGQDVAAKRAKFVISYEVTVEEGETL